MHNLILNLSVEQSSIVMQALSDFIEAQDHGSEEKDCTDALNVMTQINQSLDAAKHVIDESQP